MQYQFKLNNTRAIIMRTLLLIAAMAVISTTANAKDLFSQEKHPEAYCLALNIYYESRGSNLADQAAVADVVLNRVEDTRYPNTICEVVYQGKQRPSWKDPSKMVMVRNKCQFSWYCDGKADVPRDEEAWKKAQQLAWEMVYYNRLDITEGATHYHATYVSPDWAKDFQLIGRIGDHVYYRQK